MVHIVMKVKFAHFVVLFISIQVSLPVLAFLWRLVIRHVFFATNHACAFNRLQYSAAFIATMQFNFVTGGISLFLNTFGWEFMGLLLVNRPWKWYTLYQMIETTLSFLSVAVMRRHLMVWAIFAPRFLFAAIFLLLHCIGQLVRVVVSKK
jgi:phosphatidylinositol glycan class O